MKKILTHLKKKPEKVREQIAIISAGTVTLLVVVVWVFSLQNRFSSSNTVVHNGEETVAPEKPLNLLFNSLQQGFQDQRQELKDTNPFAHDETNAYQAPTAAEPQPLTDTASDQSATMVPAIMTDTATDTDPSKDQNNDQNIVY